MNTPDVFLTALWDLEQKLFDAWLSGPAFRERWTPEPGDFDLREHAAIATACRALALEGRKGKNLEVELLAELRKLRLLELWPIDRAPIRGLGSVDPDADLSRWRELRCLIALRRSLAVALSGISPGSSLSDVRQSILEATSQAYVSGAAKVLSDAQSIQLAVDSVTGRRSAGDLTGYSELDRITGGLRPGHVWALGAPTNWGKSSWLISVSEHYLSVHGSGALLITCEDDVALFSLRRLCRRAGIPGHAARDGRLRDHQIDAAVRELNAAAERGAAPVLLDGRGRDVESLADDIRHYAKSHGIRLVLVDYLQCIKSSRNSQDRRAEINHIARTLTDAIKTSGCAGVLASQLTGDDIRESRDVEHAAEVVLLGRKDENGQMGLYVKKNKTGQSGETIPLEWDKTTGSFITRKDEYDDVFTDYDAV